MEDCARPQFFAHRTELAPPGPTTKRVLHVADCVGEYFGRFSRSIAFGSGIGTRRAGGQDWALGSKRFGQNDPAENALGTRAAREWQDRVGSRFEDRFGPSGRAGWNQWNRP